MHKSSWPIIIQQILIWGFGWLLILIILNSGAGFDSRFWTKAILIVLGSSVVVLINLKILLPRLYFQKRRGAYYISAIALLFMIVWSIHSDALSWKKQVQKREQIENYGDSATDSQFRWLIRNLPPLFISLLGSSIVAIGAFAREKERESVMLEKSKLQAELKFLKTQINPHFLFNSLHNIYALTIIQSDLASEHLLKLSELLRYMLYESNEELVPLEREINYVENYLNLAQLKDSRGMDIKFNKQLSGKQIEIAPLLFIPFVENAFKHSKIEDVQKGYIHLELSTSDKELHFEIENSNPKNVYQKDQVGGIGLNNIRQRLLLLYPESHNLKIEDSADAFKVQLNLQF
ncbi:histidine kinase [Algoriphagus sp. SE2]|uniref:sensor histidine kinase n=1 Tax=Algoriphagus sp. SE2 TaxID=3141536 RepID=UPI0031CD369A